MLLLFSHLTCECVTYDKFLIEFIDSINLVKHFLLLFFIPISLTKLIRLRHTRISANEIKISTYRSDAEERLGSIIFLQSWWFGWPSSRSDTSVKVVVVALAGACEQKAKNWLWIQSINVRSNCMKRMAHYNRNNDWRFVSLEMDHPSMSLIMFVHLMSV